MSQRLTFSRALATPALAAFAFAISPLAAQAPHLSFSFQRAFATLSPGVLQWRLYGRSGDIFALIADTQPGATSLLGGDFELASTPNALLLTVGVMPPSGAFGFLNLPPGSLPVGMPIYCQAGEFDIAQGFGSTLVSNLDSFAGHAGTNAVVASFDFPVLLDGVFDRSVGNRLQALPAVRRTVRPLPPFAVPQLTQGPIGMLHPSGARVQMALRAADLGANGIEEELVAVRWRPLFGVVVPETYPQFEVLAAHSDVTPDYTIDDWSALPAFPLSGLSATFAQNPASTPVTLSSGVYDVRPQDLLPSGYLPFPAPQQTFAYDGQRTLLFETRCSPTPGLGQIQNHCPAYLLVMSAPTPFATVFADAGWNGQPSPLQPTAITDGTGGSFLFDVELEFVRTRSVAISSYNSLGLAAPDYLTPIVAAHTPPGTSIAIEYRGADWAGTPTTAWSSSQDVADGQPVLQFRVTMESDLVTGAVPWLDTLIVPVQ